MRVGTYAPRRQTPTCRTGSASSGQPSPSSPVCRAGIACSACKEEQRAKTLRRVPQGATGASYTPVAHHLALCASTFLQADARVHGRRERPYASGVGATMLARLVYGHRVGLVQAPHHS